MLLSSHSSALQSWDLTSVGLQGSTAPLGCCWAACAKCQESARFSSARLFLVLNSVLMPLLLFTACFWGGNCTAKVSSLVLAFSAKAWNVFFLFVLQNKASLKKAHTRFSPSLCLNHKCPTPDCFCTVNLVFLQWLLTLSCLSVCLCSCGTIWWEARKEDKFLVQNTYMEQPSRSSGWPSPSTGRLILDPVPQSLWNTSHIKSPITLLKGALMYLISKEALKEPICLSIWTDIYLFHGFLLSKGIVYSDVK